jgi:hypothetical protein
MRGMVTGHEAKQQFSAELIDELVDGECRELRSVRTDRGRCRSLNSKQGSHFPWPRVCVAIANLEVPPATCAERTQISVQKNSSITKLFLWVEPRAPLGNRTV